MTRPPAAPLRAIVPRYIGYRMTGFPPGLHRGLPSRYMTFIVSINRSIDVVAHPDPQQGPQNYGCVLSGLQASTALIAHDGNQEGVAIELSPVGSRPLFGMPARELRNLSTELADIAGTAGQELWERLQQVTGWTERFAVCDEVLLRLTGLAGPAGTETVAPELQRSWAAIVESGGRIPVRDLAALTGYTRQHLGRRFRDEFGLTPKVASRVVRFERAMELLTAETPAFTTSQIAAMCGYYDQSHLCRDFSELTGCTPSEVHEDLPFLQDEIPGGG